jgi:ATP synthase protein I
MGVSHDRSSMRDLEARLKAARGIEAGRLGSRKLLQLEQSSRYGLAWRLSAELVAGLVVGGGIGWLLDGVFGTRPWLFLVFFLLGAAAGIRSVYRVARRINAPLDEDGAAAPDGSPPGARAPDGSPPGAQAPDGSPPGARAPDGSEDGKDKR